MSVVPHRFLVRIAHTCRFVKNIPDESGDELLDLPESCRIDNFARLDNKTNFADVRLAWNEGGIGVQATVKGKADPPRGDPDKPRFSDGLALWLDTRADRNSHRASRFCHQFFLLPAAGGIDRDEPLFLQTKINRAQADAPQCDPAIVPFRARVIKGGYRIEAFLPAGVLNGFDPEDHPQLGFFYAIRDAEHGEQTLSIGHEFPYMDDPSLWAALDLVR